MSDKTEDKTTFASILAMADKAQSVITGKVEQVCQLLLALASGLSTPDQFEAGCVAAETARKARLTEIAADKGLSKDERKAFTKLPSAWSNAKSVLLRGWADHSLIPNDYETYSQYKDAKDAAVKATKVQSGDSAAQAEGVATASVQMAQGSITQVLFGDLMQRIAVLDTESQELIAEELNAIIAQFEGQKVDSTESEQTDGEALEEAQMKSVSA